MDLNWGTVASTLIGVVIATPVTFLIKDVWLVPWAERRNTRKAGERKYRLTPQPCEDCGCKVPEWSLVWRYSRDLDDEGQRSVFRICGDCDGSAPRQARPYEDEEDFLQAVVKEQKAVERARSNAYTFRLLRRFPVAAIKAWAGRSPTT